MEGALILDIYRGGVVLVQVVTNKCSNPRFSQAEEYSLWGEAAKEVTNGQNV